MKEAVRQAGKAAAIGEVPVGCVITDRDGTVIGRGRNRRESGHSALAHAENGTRVLPFKYLFRHLDGLGLKAVVVRPGLIDWNPISRTHTLEQMLTEIGEPVYRWHPKEPVL